MIAPDLGTLGDPGSWADMIAHSPCLAVSDFKPRNDAGCESADALACAPSPSFHAGASRP